MPWSWTPLGDQALLLSPGGGPDLRERIHRAAEILASAALPGVLDMVPAYRALALHADLPACPGPDPIGRLAHRALALLEGREEAPAAASRLVTLPVVYGGAGGPDLEAVALRCGLPPEEVVARHTAPEYRVAFLGFLPGFPYLEGLDPALASPRRADPRRRVPAGSVGLAGLQTGVYPLDAPGGWQLIGWTPAVLFDPERTPPCLLAPGDRLRFEAAP